MERLHLSCSSPILRSLCALRAKTPVTEAMRIHLGGHLSWYDVEKRDWLNFEQPVPISLADLAAALGLPPSEVAIISVNRQMAHWDDAAGGDDVVEFFPPMGGGSFFLPPSPINTAKGGP